MDSSLRKNLLRFGSFGLFLIVGVTFAVYEIAELRQVMIRMQTHSNLKQIGLALHEYHDQNGTFPPVAIRDNEGKPIHSWRCLIQPFLGDSANASDEFRRYDLSQSWDSAANQNSEKGHLFGNHIYQFLAIVGPHAAWTSVGTRKLKDFTDGSSECAFVIGIRNSGVHWNQPEDAQVTEDGGLSVGGHALDLTKDVFILLVDSSVRYEQHGISKADLSSLLTIDQGDKPTGR